MNFFTPILYTDCINEHCRSKKSARDLYVEIHEHYKLAKTQEMRGQMLELFAESKWENAGRPYFKVWPSIALALSKFPINVPWASGQLPQEALCVRFSRDDLLFGSYRAIFALEDSNTLWISGVTSPGHIDGLEIPLSGYATIEDSIYGGPEKIREKDELLVRLIIGICMLAKDENIIVRDVLNKDKQRYDSTTDEQLRSRLEDKAKRRGVYGWRIGEQYELIPHYRRPHPALYHTGKGRTVHKIIFRSGAIVHREKMTKVPTGYFNESMSEIE